VDQLQPVVGRQVRAPQRRHDRDGVVGDVERGGLRGVAAVRHHEEIEAGAFDGRAYGFQPDAGERIEQSDPLACHRAVPAATAAW
jgi:hypothetical protein